MRVLSRSHVPGVISLLAPLLLSVNCARADREATPSRAAAKAAPSTGPTGPIVLELFTSQGCSSCPPAEALLAKLATDRDVAPLAFHVDYWNDLGWADPYSLPAWTERQYQYSRTLSDSRVFTPELVVGGAASLVGSNASGVAAAIQRADRPALLPATAQWTASSLTVTATAPADADVWVAVWEDAAPNAVPRGENRGETLHGTRVVRRFERVATAGQPGSQTIALAPTWHASGAIAFAQRKDARIVASALLAR